VHHVNEAGNVLAFRRTDAFGNPVVVVANFSATDFAAYRIGVPAGGGWSELANSQDPQYGGTGPANPGLLTADAIAYDGFTQSLQVALPRMTLSVLAPLSYVGVGPGAEPRPALALAAPWPNPARTGATLRFSLPAGGDATLALYDVSGRLVRSLARGERPAGEHVVRWDGLDESGNAAPAGLYFARLSAAGSTRTTRLVLMP